MTETTIETFADPRDDVATSAYSNEELANIGGQAVMLAALFDSGLTEDNAQLVEVLLSNTEQFGEGPELYVQQILRDAQAPTTDGLC